MMVKPSKQSLSVMSSWLPRILLVHLELLSNSTGISVMSLRRDRQPTTWPAQMQPQVGSNSGFGISV